jgi:uncharacterized tellurite resistance protein B-like protein
MLRSLLALLRPAPVADPISGPAAVAALLVRVARADHDYTDVEAALIDSYLAARFGLNAAQAKTLRQTGETLEARTSDTVHLTRAVKEAVPLDDRPALLAQMWGLILSDDARHDDENALMRLCANLLGLSDRDSAFARQQVAAARDRTL